jgi:anti-sigma-K factor RskA
MSACPLIDEAVAYCLQQMTHEEARAYQAHLAACLSCRLKVQEIADTVDLLPLAAPPATPPAGLKARLMARLATEAQPPRPEGRRRWLLPVWAAAAVVALTLGISAMLSIRGLERQLAGFQQAAPVERTVALQGTPNAPGASGRVLVAREGSGMRIALQAQGLPPLKSGEAYQLWLIKDGKRRSGGVFIIDGTGCGGVATWFPDNAEFDALGITKEPDPLGQAPRGPKVMGSI